MRIIRWIGHPSPLEDPGIRRKLAAGVLELPLVRAIQRFEHDRRISVLPGQSIFTVDQRHGFSQPYQWGPWHFDVEMTDADWAVMQGKSPLDWTMFLDITDIADEFARVRPKMRAHDWTTLIRAAVAERQRGDLPKIATVR